MVVLYAARVVLSKATRQPSKMITSTAESNWGIQTPEDIKPGRMSCILRYLKSPLWGLGGSYYGLIVQVGGVTKEIFSEGWGQIWGTTGSETG